MKSSRANMGEQLERVLTLQHEAYRHAGIADLNKIPTPIRQLTGATMSRGMMVFRATWAKRSTVDYQGIVAIGSQPGRCVRIEAKSSKIERIPLDSVREHQAASLERTVSMGGFAAVVVLLPSGVWLVPWEFWAAQGRKSLNPALLETQGARVQDADRATQISYGYSTQVDWLSVAIERGWI